MEADVLQDFLATLRISRSACHAEGRGFESLQPLPKGLHFQAFCVRSRLVRLRRVGLTPDSPRADRRPFQEKRSVCRLILVRPNRSPSVGLQKVRCSACCGRYPGLLLRRHDPRTAPAGALPAVAVPGGQSGFSPETARSTSLRAATRLAMVPSAVSFLRRTASEAAARSPSRGASVAAVTRGSSPRVSLSIGEQASARAWAGLLVVVRSGSRWRRGGDVSFHGKRHRGAVALASGRRVPELARKAALEQRRLLGVEGAASSARVAVFRARGGGPSA
jgi:hypothetical protein